MTGYSRHTHLQTGLRGRHQILRIPRLEEIRWICLFRECLLNNHASPLRAERFVSKKIAKGVAQIREGSASELVLGDLESRVDWGYAPDYVEAMRKILSAKKADDFVIATGKAQSVGDFAKLAFKRANVPLEGHLKSRRNVAKKLAPKLDSHNHLDF